MNKKIAIRLLKDAKKNIGITSNFTCNVIKSYVRSAEEKSKVSKSTLHEYSITRDTLLGWIDRQTERNTFGAHLEACGIDVQLHDDSPEGKMHTLRKEWIDHMIKVIEQRKPLDNSSIIKIIRKHK